MSVRLRVIVVAALAGILAGCGGRDEPRLARADVAPLIALADRIAKEGPCAQARDIRALGKSQAALVSARRVPAAFQDRLASAVASLSEQTPACVPPVPAATTPPPQPQPEPVPDDEGHGRKHDKHEHKHEHKQHGKHGDD